MVDRSIAVRLFAAIVLAVLAVSGVLVPGAVAPVEAAGITVTTTSDELTVNGRCSLREAVIAANSDTAVDTCPTAMARTPST